MFSEKSDLKLIQSPQDAVFRKPNYPKPFEFNSEVADCFDNMVTRSIPMYAEVTHNTIEWALRFFHPGTVVYDIGCSTGTTLDYLAQRLRQPSTLIGIDTSAAMLAKARSKISCRNLPHKIYFYEKDACSMQYTNASVVIINYTLQFIPVAQRRHLIEKIYQDLQPEGLLILSDKLRSSSPDIQECMTAIYEDFKAERGYTRTEIARKKEALENVLIPFTWHEEMSLLKNAGFAQVQPIHQWNNFATFVGLKE